MAKKSAPAKQTAAAALLHKLLGAVAEAIANDPAIAKVAEESYGLFIDGDAEAGELEDDGFEDDDEEEEEEPQPKTRGKAAAPKGKVARRKQPTAEDLAAAVTDGDLSCLNDCDEDMLHEIAALTKVATAAKLRKMSDDEIIDALYEKFGDDEGDDGEEEELDDGFEDDDGDDNVDEFDVDEATPDELRDFAKENGIIKAITLKKEFSGNDKRTVAKLRKLITEWMDEQEEEDDGDDFGDEEFED